MATDQEFVDFVLDQFEPECAVTVRKMFGEYGVYGDGTFIGLICDNRLFFKRTATGADVLGGDPALAPPYPGAKPTFVMSEDQLEDSEPLRRMVRVTVRELAS